MYYYDSSAADQAFSTAHRRLIQLRRQQVSVSMVYGRRPFV